MSDWTLMGLALVGGLGMYFGIGGLITLVFYRRRRHAPETWKSQPDRFLTPRLLRDQLLLGTSNMAVASLITGYLAARMLEHNFTAIVFDLDVLGLPLAIATTVAYFLVMDLTLYWAHRMFHLKPLHVRFHRAHHRYVTPTPYTAAAAHPVEFFFYQGLALLPLLVLPVHVVGVVGVLVYHNLIGLLDHSGVRMRVVLPWQAPPQFHDDHHRYYHVNFGQALSFWDRIFGTWRRTDRLYTEDTYGGRGAPLGPGTPARPPLVDYRDREARDAEAIGYLGRAT